MHAVSFSAYSISKKATPKNGCSAWKDLLKGEMSQRCYYPSFTNIFSLRRNYIY